MSRDKEPLTLSCKRNKGISHNIDEKRNGNVEIISAEGIMILQIDRTYLCS